MLPAKVESINLERIQLPDVRRLEQMPSWPEWVASRIASLRNEPQPDSTTGRWRQVWTLPARSLLKESEREAVAECISHLEALCEPTVASDSRCEQAILFAVTKMMMVVASGAQNEHSAEARGEAYMAALHDVPLWAVNAAIKNWYRGCCGLDARGKSYDYTWFPAPAELRRVACRELYRIKERADLLRDLLGAERRVEFGEKHCRTMQERFAGLLAILRTSPVGIDGSGGAVSR